MHNVSELMKEGDDIRVEQERGFAFAWPLQGGSRQVAQHAIHRGLTAVLRVALEQMENGSMSVLAVAGVQVEVKVSLPSSRGRVVDHEQPHLVKGRREPHKGASSIARHIEKTQQQQRRQAIRDMQGGNATRSMVSSSL